MVRATRYSISLKHGLSLRTKDDLSGFLMVFRDLATGEIRVNNAIIVQKDIGATDGVVHIIDEVLLPATFLVHMEDQGITIG
ncbi:beta-Ig-H3/fasciclin [Elysia marginata]|uniref:Beta-Ig-H3/fasciclin n=1 Tax=Elysia marginata TaxID=1093978 RepID=A0AAV4H8I6_9GAST|nr:beta-Ig-H3/fasciclin [Elysia marginata]